MAATPAVEKIRVLTVRVVFIVLFLLVQRVQNCLFSGKVRVSMARLFWRGIALADLCAGDGWFGFVGSACCPNDASVSLNGHRSQLWISTRDSPSDTVKNPWPEVPPTQFAVGRTATWTLIDEISFSGSPINS
jgi:hypothetical protein